MTLKQKREIVRRFRAGDSTAILTQSLLEDGNERRPRDYPHDGLEARRTVEQVLRDYMNGKFKLETSKRRRTRCGVCQRLGEHNPTCLIVESRNK